MMSRRADQPVARYTEELQPLSVRRWDRHQGLVQRQPPNAGNPATAITLPGGARDRPVLRPPSARRKTIGPLLLHRSTYVPVTITIEPGIGQAGRSLAYVRRHNPRLDGPPEPVRPWIAILIALRARGLSCPLVAAAVIRMSVSRWRLRHSRLSNRWPTTATIGPVLHADPSRRGVARSPL
jgi:hypothetical protein